MAVAKKIGMSGHAGELVKRLLEKFPNAASKTIAEIAYKECPQGFKTVESARSVVRYHRGANGVKDRKTNAGTQYIRPLQKPGNPFDDLPEGIKQIDDFSVINLSCEKALIISDLHIPFHEKSAIKMALDHGKKDNVDLILINGDLMDFYSLSHWETNPKKRNLKNELDTGKAFIRILRQMFPKQRIVFKLGNHDEWLERYYSVKAPELLGVEDFELESLLKCKDYGIEVIGEKRPLRFGKLYVVHGHEFAKAAFGAPVNAARGLYLRAKTNTLGAHWHAQAEHSERQLDDKIVSCWVQACLCDLHPMYAPFNKWNLGFSRVNIERDGNFEVFLKKILNGRVY